MHTQIVADPNGRVAVLFILTVWKLMGGCIPCMHRRIPWIVLVCFVHPLQIGGLQTSRRTEPTGTPSDDKIHITQTLVCLWAWKV